jgi:hypothetical protein
MVTRPGAGGPHRATGRPVDGGHLRHAAQRFTLQTLPGKGARLRCDATLAQLASQGQYDCARLPDRSEPCVSARAASRGLRMIRIIAGSDHPARINFRKRRPRRTRRPVGDAQPDSASVSLEARHDAAVLMLGGEPVDEPLGSRG